MLNKIEVRYPSGQAEAMVWAHAYAKAYELRLQSQGKQVNYKDATQLASHDADLAVELFRERVSNV